MAVGRLPTRAEVEDPDTGLEPAGGSASLHDQERSFRYNPATFLRRYGQWGVLVINLVVFFVIWQIFSRAGVVNPLFFPAPTDIASALGDGFADGQLLSALGWSAENFAIAFAAAAVVGIPLGLAMGSSRVIYAIFSPYVWSLASLPKVAVAPLLILILGFSQWTELTLIFIAALFPIIIDCMAGPKTVDQSLVRAARVFGASKLEVYRKVIFPYTLPFIMAGLSQGLTRGLVGLIIAEIFAGNRGLGYLTVKAQQVFDSPLLYAVLVILVIISMLLVQSIRLLEAKIAPWRAQQDG